LMVQNYVAEFQRLAHANNLRFTFESYTTAGNDLDAANYVDEPTAEFWTPNGQGLDFQPTLKSMSSAAHLNRRAVVGAEAFTSGNREKWLWHPGMIKGIGDEAFSKGANRFIFHRYAAQRFADPNLKPGLQMGPWGLHYERTNTWWEWSKPWHSYLTRAQWMLRQGEFVADVLALQSEEPLLRFKDTPIQGYDYDACGPDTFRSLKVQNGLISLPNGRKYRLLALPRTATMSVPMLRRIRDLARAGASVVGQPPRATPGLSGFPAADAQLQTLVRELWGAGPLTRERKVGLGRVFSGSPAFALAQMGVAPDFEADQKLSWIHRQTPDADFYFVANTSPTAVSANCDFRISGRQPELWDAETGSSRRAAIVSSRAANGSQITRLNLELGPQGSTFVVFPKHQARVDAVAAILSDGRPLVSSAPSLAPPVVAPPRIVVETASYGVPGDSARSRDVTAKVQARLDNGDRSFLVGILAQGDDPAFGVVKSLTATYRVEGQRFTFVGSDTQSFAVQRPAVAAAPLSVSFDPKQRLQIEAREGGNYQIRLASGRIIGLQVPALPSAQVVGGPWNLSFPSSNSAPLTLPFDRLISWSQHPTPAVKYFSGTATYRKSLVIPAASLGAGKRLTLDLGRVEAMARVKLNGRDLGILWKAPYRVDVSAAAKAGANDLQIEVVNLWPNRLIGDEQSPEDSQRNPNGTLRAWPQWVLEGKPSPTGRATFSSWRLWRAGDPLQESGLLGPVTLQSTRVWTR
ncbi:MAG TPA: glycosyl hydrolase, partial [Abditibacterium sp.]